MVSFIYIAPLLMLMLVSVPTVDTFDALDVEGNVTISWVIIEAKKFSYLAMISIVNHQLYRPIEGWSLGWTWESREVIWNIVGAQTSEGGCTAFKVHKPLSCLKSPVIFDLPEGDAQSQNIANCCKGGILGPTLQDSHPQTASFRIKVGVPPFKGIRPPRDIFFLAPGARYTCDPAIATPTSTKNWLLKCNAHLNYDSPTCAVGMSSFLHNMVVQPPPCRRYGASATCTLLVQWHIMSNTVENWQVKVTITNRDNRKEWRNWNLLIRHPLANDLIIQNLKMSVYPGAAVIWGQGVFHSESTIEVSLLFRHSAKPTAKIWAFPKLLAFNGDTCMLPSEVNILTPVVTSSPSVWKKFMVFLSILATSCAAFSCAVKCVDFRRLSFRMAFKGPVKL